MNAADLPNGWQSRFSRDEEGQPQWAAIRSDGFAVYCRDQESAIKQARKFDKSFDQRSEDAQAMYFRPGVIGG